jgi:hypothetical protein
MTGQRMIWLNLLAGLALLLALLPARPAAAQTPVEVQADELLFNFPKGIIFHIEVKAQSKVEAVYLRYRTEGQTCNPSSARQAVKIEPGLEVDATWEWEFRRSGTLPPGTRLWWQWEVQTANGETVRTEVQTAQVEDQRHNWNYLSQDGVRVQWYAGPPAYGQALLDVAVESLARLQAELGMSPPDEIFLTVYPSFAEVKDAIYFTPEWTGGVAFSEQGGVIIGVPLESQGWAEEVIPHELAHLVVSRQVFNCKGISLPTWLNEGLAVLAEGPLQPGERQVVLDTLEQGRLPRLKTLESGFSAFGDDARLSYAQSSVMVEYLYQEYGPQGVADLLAAMQGGLRIDAALQQVTGLDTSGLDAHWRTSLGYAPPESEASPTLPAAVTPTRVPTLALYTSVVQLSPTPTPTPSPTPEPSPSPSPTSTPEAAPLASSPTPTPPPAVPPAGSPPWLLPGLGFALGLTAAFLLSRRFTRRPPQ